MTLPICSRSVSNASLSSTSVHSQPHGTSHRRHPYSASIAAVVKWDLIKTLAWIFLACIAAAVVALLNGKVRAIEFVTGYIVEYSLSVDNLFVFLLIFKYFKVPREAQEKVLFWGILGAMVLRGVMIVLGRALTQRFVWVTLGFAALLIYSAVRLLLENDDDDDENLDNNRIVRFSKRLFPVSDRYMGDRFVVVEGGKVFATPLMVVLVTIELSDVVFAMDSVPAVLGISKDAAVIYASNIFAVMGLRSLYFVIADAISNLRFLRQALAVVLGFIGVKMVIALLGRDLDAVYSLGFVVVALGIGVFLSIMFPSPSPAAPDLEQALEQLLCHENSN